MTVSHRTTAAPTTRWSSALTWLPRIFLAVVFAGAGFTKLAGDPAMVDMFATIGAGQGLRYVVGALELAGAVGVLVPRLSGLAAAGLALLMLGATIANVTVLGASPAVTLVLFVLAVLTVWLRRHHVNPRGRRAVAPPSATIS